MKTLSPVEAGLLSSSSQVGDPADQLVVDALDRLARASGDQRGVVARHQAPGQLALGAADRAAGLVVELDGQVGDPAGRDVGGHVHLAAAHDALLDDGRAGGAVEPGVRRASARSPRARA